MKYLMLIQHGNDEELADPAAAPLGTEMAAAIAEIGLSISPSDQRATTPARAVSA
jgi:hypothetical protein